MKGKKWLWATFAALPLLVGGLVYAGVQAGADAKTSDAPYVCPLTGEELPCPKCCPLD